MSENHEKITKTRLMRSKIRLMRSKIRLMRSKIRQKRLHNSSLLTSEDNTKKGTPLTSMPYGYSILIYREGKGRTMGR